MAANVEGKQDQPGRHQEVGHKSLLQSDALYQVYHVFYHRSFETPQEINKGKMKVFMASF